MAILLVRIRKSTVTKAFHATVFKINEEGGAHSDFGIVSGIAVKCKCRTTFFECLALFYCEICALSLPILWFITFVNIRRLENMVTRDTQSINK